MAIDAYVPFLIAGMLLTGCSNSLWTKWQDMQCVENCGPLDDPTTRVFFEQPVWQTLQMFVGEVGCFIPVLYTYLRTKNTPAPLLTDDDADITPRVGGTATLSGWKVFLFFLPAACDLTGTTLMNVGLLYTPVSIYQMTRGALVLWVGIFSVLFLKRRLFLYQWLSLVTVMAGVSIVGLSGSLIKKAVSSDESVGNILLRHLDPKATADTSEAVKVFIGVLFILFAQFFTAFQFVLEEKIMAQYSVEPLVAVGLEGTFGLVSVLAVMPLLYTLKDVSVWFDLPRGWDQMTGNKNVLVSSVIIAFSIGFFNFFGLSVTRTVSATARSTIDTCRTLGIWLVSLGLGWETLQFPFSALQVLGFGLLVYGTFVFNNLVLPPAFVRPHHTHLYSAVPNENSPLLATAEDAILDEERRRHLDQTATLPSDIGRSGFDVVPPPARGD